MRRMCWWHTANCTDLFYYYCISSLMFSLSFIICLDLVGEQKTLLSGCSYTFSYRFRYMYVVPLIHWRWQQASFFIESFLQKFLFVQRLFFLKTFLYSLFSSSAQLLLSVWLCITQVFCSIFVLLLYTFMLFQNYCLIETYLVLCMCRCICVYPSTLSAHSRFHLHFSSSSLCIHLTLDMVMMMNRRTGCLDISLNFLAK